jgi:hypothetical protein
MRFRVSLGTVLLLGVVCCGCGHTNLSRVGLLSVGDWDSKTIPASVSGPVLVGKDLCKVGGDSYYLSEAVRNALKGTPYDTLIDAEVTTKTGLFVWSNTVEVKGKGLDSKVFPKNGGVQ